MGDNFTVIPGGADNKNATKALRTIAFHDCWQRQYEIAVKNAIINNADKEILIHIFDDTIDRVGQFSCFIQIQQMSEVTAILAASKTVLNVITDSCIDISSRGFIITEGGILYVQVGVVKIHFTRAERAAVTDILVDIMDSEKSCVFSERDERCVYRVGSVVQFFVFGKPEAERIRTR